VADETVSPSLVDAIARVVGRLECAGSPIGTAISSPAGHGMTRPSGGKRQGKRGEGTPFGSPRGRRERVGLRDSCPAHDLDDLSRRTPRPAGDDGQIGILMQRFHDRIERPQDLRGRATVGPNRLPTPHCRSRSRRESSRALMVKLRERPVGSLLLCGQASGRSAAPSIAGKTVSSGNWIRNTSRSSGTSSPRLISRVSTPESRIWV
jgi:hypothetical protein